MIWENWLESVALGLNTSITQTGIMLSMIGIISIMVIVSVATRGRGLEVLIPLTTLMGVLFFIFLGWLPVYLGTVLAVVMAVYIGSVVLRGG